MTVSDNITELEPNQIFCFGSNLDGRHAGGAASQAAASFGAIEGIGVGLQGQTYGIPTMHGTEVMRAYCRQFVDFAKHYPEYEFLLTPVGQGIAGHPKAEVEAMFIDLPSNVKKVGW